MRRENGLLQAFNAPEAKKGVKQDKPAYISWVNQCVEYFDHQHVPSVMSTNDSHSVVQSVASATEDESTPGMVPL